jgi:hypothetical protein
MSLNTGAVMMKYTFLLLFCSLYNAVAMDALQKKTSSQSLIRRPKNKVPLLQVLTAEQLYESFQMSKVPKTFQTISERLCETYMLFLKPENIRFLHATVIQAYIFQRKVSMRDYKDNPRYSLREKKLYIIDSFNIFEFLNR